MKLAKRDWIFMAMIAVVLVALVIGNRSKHAFKKVPNDGKHSRYYQLMQQGSERIRVEKECTVCHGSTTPLSKAHPPKEQCLICHQLFQINK